MMRFLPCLLLLTQEIHCFSPSGYTQKFGVTKALFAANTEDDIDAAERSLQEEEDRMRADDRETAMLDMEKGEYKAMANEYDDMRERLRQRAGTMDLEQSKTTEEAIQRAAERALTGEDADETELDLSKIGAGSKYKPNADGTVSDEEQDEFERDLTPEELIEFDPTGQMSLIEQFKTEMDGVKWPTPGAVARQFLLAMAALAFMVWFILFMDQFLRTNFMEIGLYPNPEETAAEIERLGLKNMAPPGSQ